MKLDKNEIVFASMTPKEALEFTKGDPEKIKFLRGVKAKARRIEAPKKSTPNDMLKYIEHSIYAYGDGPKPKNFDEKYLNKILNNPKLAMSETPEEETEMLLGGEALEFMKWLKKNPDGTYNDWLKDKETGFKKDDFKIAAATENQQKEAEKLIEIEKKKMELDPFYIPEIIDPEEVKKAQVEENLFEKYLELLKAGELLPNTSFEMFEKNYHDFDTDVISKINKRVKEMKQSEGIARII